MDIIQWLAAAANSIKIGESISKLFKTELLSTSKLGLAKITPVIFSGTQGGAGEYPASNDPNAPLSHIVPVEIPKGARIVTAWYTPLHNIQGILAFAYIDVEPYNDNHILLKVAAFQEMQSRVRLAIHVLFTK